MKRYSYKNVKFSGDLIIFEKKNDYLQINKYQIWTMYYAKWSLKNFIFVGELGFTMGYLYIALKDSKRLEDVIRIRYPYKKLLKIPTLFLDMIEFYKPNEYAEIFKLKHPKYFKLK